MEKEESFLTKLRCVRDGGLAPKDSWKLRHGHTFMGYTLHLWVIKPFIQSDPDDIKWMLLHAASVFPSTDIQIHFTRESVSEVDELNKKLGDIYQALIKSEYTPITFTVRLNHLATGWIRIPLFSVDDLPESPFEEVFSTKAQN